MIAAVYARKSTKQSDVNDADKSVPRQITLAKQFAAEKKWDILDIYADDGVSGQEATKLVNRSRVLADALAGKFQALIVRDYDRLSRDDREGPSFIYALDEAGIAIYEYTDGSKRPLDVSTAAARLMLNVKAFGSAHQAESSSKNTREQKFAKAERGALADGRVLGYRNEGPAKARVRVVDQEQAALVTRIFTMASEGKGLLKIANTLNREGIVNPTGQSRGGEPESAKKFWAPSGLRAILHRELYVGRQTYGTTKNLRRGGKRIKVEGTNPITVERPDLRVISDELWASAHRVMGKRRKAYVRANNGELRSKPESGLESNYLLGGFVRCGRCGGSMVVVKRSGRRGRPTVWYRCRTRLQRPGACAQDHAIKIRELDDAVRLGLDEVLTPERLDAVLQQLAADAARQTDSRDVQRAGLQADLSLVETALKNFMAALARGDAFDSIRDAIREHEARRRELRGRLESLDAEARTAGRASREETLAGLRTICKDWRTLLRSNPPLGRRVLRDLRIERVVVAQDAQGEWFYRLEGDLSKALGLPDSFTHIPDDPADRLPARPDLGYSMVCPRGDSNTRHAV